MTICGGIAHFLALTLETVVYTFARLRQGGIIDSLILRKAFPSPFMILECWKSWPKGVWNLIAARGKELVSSGPQRAVEAQRSRSVRRASSIDLLRNAHMSGTANLYRLAITYFEDPGNLRDAVKGLLDAGQLMDQICLVALPELMAGLLGARWPDDADRLRLLPLCGDLSPWPGAAHEHEIVASQGPLLQSLIAGRIIGNGREKAIRLPNEHKAEVDDRVRRGAIALLVRSTTQSQQLASTRILLKLSTSGVRTYEFPLTAARGGGVDS